MTLGPGEGRDAQSRKVGEALAVARGVPGPRRVPAVHVAQLDVQDRALDPLHARVVAELDVVMAPVLGVVPEPADPLGHVRIVGHDAAGFAERAQVLAGVEAEAPDPAEGSHPAVAEAGAVGLGAAIKYLNSLPRQELVDTEDELIRNCIGRLKQIPGARLVEIAGAGHMAPMEKPVEVSAAMLEFLSTL